MDSDSNGPLADELGVLLLRPWSEYAWPWNIALHIKTWHSTAGKKKGSMEQWWFYRLRVREVYQETCLLSETRLVSSLCKLSDQLFVMWVPVERKSICEYWQRENMASSMTGDWWDRKLAIHCWMNRSNHYLQDWEEICRAKLQVINSTIGVARSDKGMNWAGGVVVLWWVVVWHVFILPVEIAVKKQLFRENHSSIPQYNSLPLVNFTEIHSPTSQRNITDMQHHHRHHHHRQSLKPNPKA